MSYKVYPVQSPCLGCSNRAIGCHAHCDKYKDWKKALGEFNKKAKKEEVGRF